MTGSSTDRFIYNLFISIHLLKTARNEDLATETQSRGPDEKPQENDRYNSAKQNANGLTILP